MSNRLIGYGIDFGTTNSLISIAYDDRVDLLAVSDSAGGDLAYCMPSIVYFDRDDDYRVGEDAIDQFVTIGAHSTRCNDCEVGCNRQLGDLSRRRGERRQIRTSCSDARLSAGMKSLLAAPSYAGTKSWGRRFELADMVGWILEDLAKRADREARARNVPVAIGVPVHYEAEGDGRRDVALARMQQAAARAGFNTVEFLEEPVAALAYEMATVGDEPVEGPCLALDFGGGTFDATLSLGGSRAWRSGRVFSEGVAVGGEVIDRAILEQMIAPAAGLGDVLSRLKWLCRRDSALMAAGDPDRRDQLSAHAKADYQGAEDFKNMYDRALVAEFWREIENAKIALSLGQSVDFDFVRRGVDIRARLESADFERVIRPYLEQIRDVVQKVIAAAGLQASDVRQVIQTGGSSSLPAFKSLVHGLFLEARIDDRPPLMTIGSGLGCYLRLRAQGVLSAGPVHLVSAPADGDGPIDIPTATRLPKMDKVASWIRGWLRGGAKR